MSELIPPILCVGATRSGTSMLVRMLGSLPGCACWYEPNALWRVGHAYRPHDFADETDAKPWVRRWIRRAFLRFQQAHGGARVIEKSPYNVVRLRFIHAVFPEAKIVHIHRDGRANLRSQVEKFDTFQGYTAGSAGHVMRRLREVPPWEFPAYAPRAIQGVLRTHVLRKPIRWFGLRYPGWKDDAKRLTQAQRAAKQWVVAMEHSLRDLETLPQDVCMRLTYEQLVSDPRAVFQQIIDFCGLESDDAFWRRVDEKVHVRSIDRWKEQLDPKELDEAMPTLQPMLERLGYE